ncbi:CTP synthase [Cocos nucifera]|uniref:CTP synthase n=1 Tax=Cocos nucifera TaxID=13894 RepID=A0A8K0IYU1_COCNU|nr:CTP synthase [Cocos nucifera]
MAYIPPHRRHSKDAEKPSPVPESLIPSFKRGLHLGSKPGGQDRRERANSSHHRGFKIIYAPHSISRWWLAGEGDLNPASLHLEPVSCEVIERKIGGKPLVLTVGADPPAGSADERPWVSIAERIEPDLLACAQSARNEIASESEEIKLAFVARFGKIMFHGDPSVCLNSIRNTAVAKLDARNQVHKSFYTNVPSEYMEEIQRFVVPMIGFEFEAAKEHYHVKVFDKCRPDSTISCKCTTKKGGELEIYKDEESDGLGKLITSAIIDPDVKGGLRWPLGKEFVDERFNIVGVWHTKYKAYKYQTLKLKLRHADRFDYRTSVGEVADEVSLKLLGLSKRLRVSSFDSYDHEKINH